MESSTVQPTPTLTEKIVKVPVEVGTALVQGTETVARDSAQVLVTAATVVVEAGQTVVRDVVKAGEELVDGKQPTASPATPAAIDPTVPAVALAAAVTVPA
jgi:hypothetical protein